MWFKRKRNKGQENPVKDKAAKGIARFLLTIQVKFATLMNAVTKHLSSNSMKILVFAFCVFGGGLSSYLISKAIINPQPDDLVFKVDQLNVPKYYHRNDDDLLNTGELIDKETYQRIEAFDEYMDSLQQSINGRKTHDSILTTRPGLLDSIRMLKEIYNSQLK